MPVVTLTKKNSATKDTMIAQNSPTGNYDSNLTSVIGTMGTASSAYRTLLLFDFGLIPNNAIINSATLKLYKESGGGNVINIHKITSNWVASSVNWNTQPSFDAAVASSFTAPTTNGVVNIDLTTLVQDWINGSSNFGMLIKNADEVTLSKNSTFTSLESSTIANQPQLVVDYTIPTTGKKQVDFGTITTGTAVSSPTSYTLPTSSVKAGDLMIATLISANYGTTFTAPAGWTSNPTHTPVNARATWIGYKIATTDAESVVFTVGGTLGTVQGSVTTFKNVKKVAAVTYVSQASATVRYTPLSSTYNWNGTRMVSLLYNLLTDVASSVITTPLNYAVEGSTQLSISSYQTLSFLMGYMHDKTSLTPSETTAEYSIGSIGLSMMFLLEPITNTVPNTPPTNNPKGTSVSPAIITTSTPTLSWTFSDNDVGDTQKAFQVIVRDGNTPTTIVYDSGKVTSASTTFQIPSGKILVDKLYSWEVMTWDASDAQSPTSSREYFKVKPDASLFSYIRPGTDDQTHPGGAALNPLITWDYAKNVAQSRYRVKLWDGATNVLDTNFVTSALKQYQVPNGTLAAGKTYGLELIVTDGANADYPAQQLYFITNNAPSAPVLLDPVDTCRTILRPTFVAIIGSDVEKDKQHFVIQIAEDSAFTIGLQERYTQTAQTGWEVHDGTVWVPFPSGGVDSSFEDKKIRYSWQSDLSENKTYYWRMAAIDGTSSSRGQWSMTRTIRAGNILLFILHPRKTKIAASRVVFNGIYTLAQDGATPATLKIEVCNNGFDSDPTWEDVTSAYLSGTYHKFENTTKTASEWGIATRVTVIANDSLGPIDYDASGSSFN